MTQTSPRHGHVHQYTANYYRVRVDVQDGCEYYNCTPKGLLKKEGVEVLVGDGVDVDSLDPANHIGRITRIHPRKNMLSRPKAANIDQTIIVHALCKPDFDPHQLDRYLTHTALAKIPPLICLSKTDLEPAPGRIQEIQTLYQHRLGYTVLPVSIHSPESLLPLIEQAHGKVSVMAGSSGAGKSSIFNRLNPALKLQVGDISDKISRGRHTTRHVSLLEVQPDVFMMDTPGFSNLKFNTVLPQEVERVFPEFVPYREECAYSNCLHISESGCAVLEHITQIPPTRYASYLEIIAEAQAYKETLKTTSQKEKFGIKTLHSKGKESLQILRLEEKFRGQSRRTIRQSLQTPVMDDNADSPHEYE